LASSTGEEAPLRLNSEIALVIASLLRAVEPDQRELWKWDNAVRLIFFDAWYTIGQECAQCELEPILADSWAGGVLARMKAHYRARQKALAAYREYNNHETIRKRHEEKARARQQRHAERLKGKRPRGQIGIEEHKKVDS
jgi:hypothetical protein